MKNKNIIRYGLILLSIMFIMMPFISAMPQYKAFTSADLKIAIYNSDGSPATNAANCTIDIIYPNQSSLVIGGAMSFLSNGIFDYNINGGKLNVNGIYSCHVKCSQSAQYLYSDFNIQVTPTGVIQGSIFNNPIPIILVVLAIILLVIAFYNKNKPMGFLAGIMFAVAGVYIMIYGFNNYTDMYTQAAGYILIGIGSIFVLASGYEMLSDLNESKAPEIDED